MIIDEVGVDVFITEIRPLLKEHGFIVKPMSSDIRKRKRKFKNSDNAWTTTEESALGKAFESGLSIWQITTLHERTPTSLLRRLVKNGFLSYELQQKGWLRLCGTIYATYHDVKVFEKDQPNIKKPKKIEFHKIIK